MSRPTTAAMRFAALLAAAVACAVAAQSASAAWYVAGTELTGSASLATTATVVEPVKLKAAGVTIECAGSSLTTTGGEIKAPNKLTASSLTFNGCKANEKCTVPSAITTVPVAAELTEQTLEDSATFAAKTKTIFATIKYEGSSCALAGTQAFSGKAAVKFPSGEEEETLQEVRANVLEASSEFKLGSSAAELKAAADFKLTSGQEFEWVPFAQSKEFALDINKKMLTKLENKATVTITAKIANAEVKALRVSQIPAAQFVTIGRPLCEGVYVNALEKCTFEIEYVGNEQAVGAVQLEDKVGDFLRKGFEGK